MTLFKYLHVGGLVAMGFDFSGEFLLVVSHAGRGVFSTQTWERVARDYEVVYPSPDVSYVQGIGNLSDQLIPIIDRLYLRNEITLTTPDKCFELHGDSEGISIFALNP